MGLAGAGRIREFIIGIRRTRRKALAAVEDRRASPFALDEAQSDGLLPG
jgi:hypothetical protein